MKRILVTGCFGFIASHTIEELHQRGYEVIGLARHVGQGPIPDEMFAPDNLYLADMRDKEAVEKAVSMSEGVINLAGILGTQETVQNPYPSVEVNVFGALNVLEAAKVWKVPVIQITVGNYFEKNSYSLTKTCAEGFVQMYAKNNKVSANAVRALNAFGERQKARPVRKIIPSFITRAINNQPIQIYGDGNQLMDMIYVKDVANILINALEDITKEGVSSNGVVYEAGTGIGMRVADIAEKVIKAVGSTSQIEFLPMRPGETPGAQVIAKNPVEYPYTNFDTALRRTVDWYKENEFLWNK